MTSGPKGGQPSKIPSVAAPPVRWPGRGGTPAAQAKTAPLPQSPARPSAPPLRWPGTGGAPAAQAKAAPRAQPSHAAPPPLHWPGGRPPAAQAKLAPPPPASAVQRQAASPAAARCPGRVVQRYPVGLSGATLTTTSGRPDAKSNKGTIQGIVKNIYTQGPYNEYEQALYNMGSQSQAVTAVHSGGWRSQNGATICHKMAISEIEDYVVAYANAVVGGTSNTTLENYMKNLIKRLTVGYSTIESDALLYLQQITNAPTTAGLFGNAAVTAQGHCDSLILILDGSPANLYIGSSQTNSSIQERFDPHYDVSDPLDLSDVNASPISRGIYDQQHITGPLLGLVPQSPVRASNSTGDWVETSSVSQIGWVVIDRNTHNI